MTTLIDAGVALALNDLAEFWRHPQPCRFTGRVPPRLAGSDQDQLTPAGMSNPYWEIIRHMPLTTVPAPWIRQPEIDQWFFIGLDGPWRERLHRHALVSAYAWAIPSPGDIAWITERLGGRGIIEAGAGLGYWAWLLDQAGNDVIAYEPKSPDRNHYVSRDAPWFPVREGDHTVTARHPDRALLLCWPSYDSPWAAQALAAYRGDQLFFVGEGQGGCTADDEFFGRLEAGWAETGNSPHHVTYHGIRCYLTEYRLEKTHV